MHKTKYLASTIALVIIFLSSGFSNFFQRVRDVDWINYVSQFVYIKYSIQGNTIAVYGLGRCGRGQTIKAYNEYGIDGDHQLSKNLIHLAYFVSTFIVVEYIFINIKYFNYNILSKLNFGKSKQYDSEKPTIPRKMNQNLICDNNTISSQMMIAWTDLSLSIPITSSFYSLSRESLTIFNAINGSFAVQSLNALMGPSGVGKSTLLKCLNNKCNKYLSEESKIFFKFSDILRNVFIKQDISEHLLSGLTVGQTLLYASKLKNSRIDKNLDHNSIISQLLSELLISDTIDNRVESCSGGEQKRIAIACELTAEMKPKILFIDEPTSGLDSMAAHVVCDEKQCNK